MNEKAIHFLAKTHSQDPVKRSVNKKKSSRKVATEPRKKELKLAIVSRHRECTAALAIVITASAGSEKMVEPHAPDVQKDGEGDSRRHSLGHSAVQREERD